MAFQPVSIADIYQRAEAVKGAQQGREFRGMQMDQMNQQNDMNKLAFMGRLAQAAKATSAPSHVFRSALGDIQKFAPEEHQKLVSTFGPNLEGLDDTKAASMTQYLEQLTARGQAAQGQNTNTPAGLAEFNAMTEGLTPEQVAQARKIALGLESRAGQTRVMDVNGVPTVVVNTNQGPVQIPLSDLQETAGAAGTIKQAEALGSGRGQAQAKQEAEAPTRERARQQQETAISNTMEMVDELLADVGPSTSGVVGAATGGVVGTPAYNWKQKALTVKANLGFDKLQAMRDASPTGGALGQVSEREIDLLTSAVANIDQAQDPEQLRKQLARVKRHYENWLDIIEEARQQDQFAPKNNADPLSALTPEQREKYGL